MNMKHQRGFFAMIAVILILVMGTMGAIITYVLSTRAQLSVAQLNGLRTFYLAESGLEIAARLLTLSTLSGTPSRVACANLSGLAAVTNASLNNGTFTITTLNSSPVYATTTLSAAMAATDTTLSVSSTSGFAPNGFILIDNEVLSYGAISGNTFINVLRGLNNSLASSHTNATGVSQYECSISSQAGIPSIASPQYQRQLEWAVQLQDGWTVGNTALLNYVLSRWNYSTELQWTSSNLLSLTTANLNGLDMLSSAEGWAVGDARAALLTLLHWTTSGWSLYSPTGCSGQNLLDVSSVSSQEAWAVGVRYKNTACTTGSYRFTILRWNGSAWSILSPTTTPAIPADNANNQNLNAISVIDNNGNGLGDIGFTVGSSGYILQYNGTQWSTATSPTTQNLNGVYVVSAKEAWAVGNSGVILKWNGTSWSTFTSPTSTQLNAVTMLDTNNDGIANVGWAVGNSGIILQYNGTSWSATTSGSNNLLSVSIINATDVWAVGVGGTALHWDGNAWTSFSSGTSQQLNAISLISSGLQPVSSWQQVFR